jgi:hypothetical protein
MTLFRLFPFDPDAPARSEGGPLFVARHLQGGGRHDNPGVYGALYLSRSTISPIAEHLAMWRASGAAGSALRPEGRPMALVGFDDARLDELVGLDDPRALMDRGLRPSGVATRERRVTRPLAKSLYDEGVTGFEWWSTIEAGWVNATLFADRALDRLEIADEPEALTIQHPLVREAAETVGVRLVA